MDATREAPSVAWHAPTGPPRGAGRVGRGGGGAGVAMRPGNAGGAKGPQFGSSVGRGTGHGDWREPISPAKRSETPYMQKRRDLRAFGSTRCATRCGVPMCWRLPVRRCAATAVRPGWTARRSLASRRTVWMAWGIGAGPEGPIGRMQFDRFSYPRSGADSFGPWAFLAYGTGWRRRRRCWCCRQSSKPTWHRSNTPIVRAVAHTMPSSACIGC